MSLLQRVLALLDRFDPVMQEWRRQDGLNYRSYRLYRIGFTFDQQQGRVNEAIPGWMVKKDEPQRPSEGGSAAGAGQKGAEATAPCPHLRKRPGPGEIH